MPAAAERRDKRNAAAVVKPRPAVETRPRSPNPTAMPESLRKAPPLKPTLDPSAKSWIEIAVSQRGPSRNGKAGPRPGQAQGQGPQSRDQAFPGTASLKFLVSCLSWTQLDKNHRKSSTVCQPAKTHEQTESRNTGFVYQLSKVEPFRVCAVSKKTAQTCMSVFLMAV